MIPAGYLGGEKFAKIETMSGKKKTPTSLQLAIAVVAIALVLVVGVAIGLGLRTKNLEANEAVPTPIPRSTTSSTEPASESTSTTTSTTSTTSTTTSSSATATTRSSSSSSTATSTTSSPSTSGTRQPRADFGTGRDDLDGLGFIASAARCNDGDRAFAIVATTDGTKAAACETRSGAKYYRSDSSSGRLTTEIIVDEGDRIVAQNGAYKYQMSPAGLLITRNNEVLERRSAVAWGTA